MKKLLLTFGALMAFNAMINAQAPRPDRAGGPAAAPQGTETKSDDAAGRGAKPGATKPAATTRSFRSDARHSRPATQARRKTLA